MHQCVQLRILFLNIKEIKTTINCVYLNSNDLIILVNIFHGLYYCNRKHKPKLKKNETIIIVKLLKYKDNTR